MSYTEAVFLIAICVGSTQGSSSGTLLYRNTDTTGVSNLMFIFIVIYRLIHSYTCKTITKRMASPSLCMNSNLLSEVSGRQYGNTCRCTQNKYIRTMPWDSSQRTTVHTIICAIFGATLRLQIWTSGDQKHT